MHTHETKTQTSKHHSGARINSPEKNGNTSGSHFADNRPEAAIQRKLNAMAANIAEVSQTAQLKAIVNNRTGTPVQMKSPEEEELLQGKFMTVQKKAPEEEELLQGKFDPVQMKAPEEEELQMKPAPGSEKENQTGLPDNLKTGIESLSGMSLDDVNVHYNSDKPAGLQALAYAQGTDIHVGPGQEKHLPHEAWHVVQQKQGRVKPTMQMKGRVNVNDDVSLEKEADVMGAKALNQGSKILNGGQEIQRVSKSTTGIKDIAQRNVVQRVLVAGIEVSNKQQMPTWEQDGVTYHVNLTTETFHITQEGIPKIQYFYEGYGDEIKDKQPTKAERGKSKKKKKGDVIKTKRVFSDLPQAVQDFIRTNYTAILKAD